MAHAGGDGRLGGVLALGRELPCAALVSALEFASGACSLSF